MSLGKVPVKAGGSAKQNASLKQGRQVSNLATQRVTTTTRHRHTEKLRGDAYQPLYSPRITKREGQTATQKQELVLKRTAQPSRGGGGGSSKAQ